MIPTRAHSASHSSMLCDVRTRHRPRNAVASARHSRRRDFGSIPVLGSSRRTTAGSPTSAIATESFRFVPPLYPAAGTSAYFSNPRRRMSADAASFAAARDNPRSVPKNARCSLAVIVPCRASYCGQYPTCCRTRASWVRMLKLSLGGSDSDFEDALAAFGEKARLAYELGALHVEPPPDTLSVLPDDLLALLSLSRPGAGDGGDDAVGRGLRGRRHPPGPALPAQTLEKPGFAGYPSGTPMLIMGYAGAPQWMIAQQPACSSHHLVLH